ncbi:MAG: hypothetical protein OEZ09_12590 [Betaproteobacteria bacterium]|nr:hypothetical protein [Betaproteobacteria bacterium]MDH4323147.1 hypothetical protein [Betaproteobacteria bacterium]MDH5211463.1 hypothetical protein [Betaproteobacteria bacterium]MDH5579283.1 hypothetical protein [Betaproteobacteria bacterium]
MLREFSRRTTAALRAALPLRLALPVLEPFLAENVAKEVRKDALVIRRAAAGRTPGDARELLAAARAIDREFLARIGDLPVRIEIPYDRIEPLRLRRIELGLDTAQRMLDAWRGKRRAREAFAPGELERRLFEMLQMYAEETEALSHAVRLPMLLAPLRERIAQHLREAMRQAARSLTRTAHAAGQNG